MATETSPLLSVKAERSGVTEEEDRERRGTEGPGRGYMFATLCGLCFTGR